MANILSLLNFDCGSPPADWAMLATRKKHLGMVQEKYIDVSEHSKASHI